MTEYVLVERDRWERVRRGAEHGYYSCMSRSDGWMCTYDEILKSDLDPVEPVTLSGAGRDALARDIERLSDEQFHANSGMAGWAVIADALLTRWHIVRRTPELGAE